MATVKVAGTSPLITGTITSTSTSTSTAHDASNGTLHLRGSSSPIPTTFSPYPPPPPPPTPSAKRVLLAYHQLPPWLQDNIHIHRHYRPLTPSIPSCLHSWTYLHNESVNIFSHLLPALLVLALINSLCYTVFPRWYPLATSQDKLVLGIFLSSAALCFGVSAGFHTLLCHSESVARRLLHMDFLGIVALIEGCFVSGIYVGFYCERDLQRVYWGMILSLGLLCAITVSSPKFQGPEWRTFRLGVFIGTGLSALAPIAHGIALFGLRQMMRQSGLPYYLLEGAIIVLGAWIYNTRLPESLYPGRFDIWGSSHQIFHVLVVVAMGVHLVAITQAYGYNYSQQRCAFV